MDKLPTQIVNELREFRDTQEYLIQHYQSKENNEMAYLVRWSILEKVVKTVATESRRQNLISTLQAWLAHAKKGGPRPSNKPNTATELRTLPQKNEFIDSLNQYGLLGEDMWAVMDSKGKHRRHRNEIAHTGKKFINYLLYMQLMTDMARVTKRVFQKIESNKSIKSGSRKRHATT